MWSYQHFQKLELPFFDLKNLNARAYWFFKSSVFLFSFQNTPEKLSLYETSQPKKDMSSVLFFFVKLLQGPSLVIN